MNMKEQVRHVWRSMRLTSCSVLLPHQTKEYRPLLHGLLSPPQGIEGPVHALHLQRRELGDTKGQSANVRMPKRE